MSAGGVVNLLDLMYFRKNLLSFKIFVSKFFSDSLDASNCGTDDKFVKAGLEDIVASIHTMFKITQQRQELQRCFVTSLIPALLVLKCNILHSTALQNLFEEVSNRRIPFYRLIVFLFFFITVCPFRWTKRLVRKC